MPNYCRELCMVSPEPAEPAWVMYGVPGTSEPYGVPGTEMASPEPVWCPRNRHIEFQSCPFPALPP